MNSFLRGGIVAISCCWATGCVVSVDSQGQIVREEKRFSPRGTPDLHLATFDGSIEVRSAEANQVLVEIEKRGPTREAVEALRVESSQDGSRIRLEVKQPRTESTGGFRFHRAASASLIVTVPRRSNIFARTGDGAIRLEGITGRVELRTGDGSIRITDVSGELVLNTGDGAVDVDNAEGRLALETGDGGVNVEGKLSTVKIHTGDGSIAYRAGAGAKMDDDWDISTGDGSVSLYLPEAFNAELDAHTGDGAIRHDLGIPNTADGVDDRDKRTLRARLGDGGRRLRIQTGDGSITLKTR